MHFLYDSAMTRDWGKCEAYDWDVTDGAGTTWTQAVTGRTAGLCAIPGCESLFLMVLSTVLFITSRVGLAACINCRRHTRALHLISGSSKAVVLKKNCWMFKLLRVSGYEEQKKTTLELLTTDRAPKKLLEELKL